MIPDKLMKAMNELGYSSLLPVQEAVFPLITEHCSIALQSATGTGKTFSYLLPAAAMKEKTLIIAPARELAVQIRDDLSRLTVYEKIHSALLIGGADLSYQRNQLKQDPLFIIATPGRLCDCIRRNELDLHDIRLLILDEADQIISTGQYESMKQILSHLPADTVYVCVSATCNEKLADLLPGDIYTVTMDDPNQMNSLIQGYFCITDQKKKTLLKILSGPDVRQAVVFVNHKSDAERLAVFLQKRNMLAAPFSSRYEEKQRLNTIRDFTAGNIRVLCATDAAARGLDLPVSHIIHYDMPMEKDTFIHRSGRTAHQGEAGISIMLMTSSEAASEEGKELSRDLSVYIPRGSQSDALSVPAENHIGKTNTQKFLLRAGKKDKLRKGDIIGALCSVVSFSDIGIVDLQDRYCVITILSADETLLSRLSPLYVKGKKRKMEILHNENGLSLMKGR